MALKHVLLGLLAYKPSSGYSLHKMFFDPARPMLSQIYRALNEMYAEGIVDFERVEQKKLPARNVFHLTKAGRGELDKWIRKPWAVGSIREPFVLILWFSRLVKKEDIIENVKTYRDKKKDELEYYNSDAKGRVQKSWKGYGNPLDKFYWDLAFDYIQRRGTAELEWAEATIKRISNLKTEHGIDTGEAKRKKGEVKGQKPNKAQPKKSKRSPNKHNPDIEDK